MWGMPVQWNWMMNGMMNGMMGGECPFMGGWWSAPPSGQRITIQ
jgi:hypothetical protein